MKFEKLFKKNDKTNIIFKDIYLQLLVGKWLGVLDESSDTMQKAYNVSYRFKYANLSNEKLRRKVHISKHKLIEVNNRFREVLNNLGISTNEVCVLNNLNENDDTFYCYFENEKEDLKINLNFGNVIGFNKKISIENKNEKRVYNYVGNDNSFKIKIAQKDTKNSNNKYSRTYDAFFSIFSVENGNYKINIYISNPKNISLEDNDNYNYILTNEDEIKEYLLNLEFPIEIDKLYKDITNFLKPNSIAIYPTFNLTINKKSDIDYLKVSDEIVLRNGNLEKFIITRNEMDKITIDNKNGYWKYESDDLSVSRDKNNILNYQFKGHVSNFEIDYLNSVKGNIKSINNEVEKVKELSKTL